MRKQIAATVPLAIIFPLEILYFSVKLSPLIDSIITTLQIGLWFRQIQRQSVPKLINILQILIVQVCRNINLTVQAARKIFRC